MPGLAKQKVVDRPFLTEDYPLLDRVAEMGLLTKTAEAGILSALTVAPARPSRSKVKAKSRSRETTSGSCAPQRERGVRAASRLARGRRRPKLPVAHASLSVLPRALSLCRRCRARCR